MPDYDVIAYALQQLDAECPKKNVHSESDPADPRRRIYTVPTMEGRRQVVQAVSVPDSLFGERLELISVAVRELPQDAGLLIGLFALSRNFRRARLLVFDPTKPQLAVAATFVPDEVHDGAGPRLLHALREVASIADSIENQITGVDME